MKKYVVFKENSILEKYLDEKVWSLYLQCKQVIFFSSVLVYSLRNNFEALLVARFEKQEKTIPL